MSYLTRPLDYRPHTRADNITQLMCCLVIHWDIKVPQNIQFYAMFYQAGGSNSSIVQGASGSKYCQCAIIFVVRCHSYTVIIPLFWLTVMHNDLLLLSAIPAHTPVRKAAMKQHENWLYMYIPMLRCVCSCKCLAWLGSFSGSSSKRTRGVVVIFKLSTSSVSLAG